MTNLVDIFEETRDFDDRTFLLRLPPETINIINNNTTLPPNQSFNAALGDILSDSMKIKYLVRLIQYNADDTLDFPEKTVTLRGATNDSSKLTLWYEISSKGRKPNSIFMCESMSTPNNLNWISNKTITKNISENSLELEDIDVIAIEFPSYDEGGTLYFPFYILMMLRSFSNNAQYFYINTAEYLISLYFIVPQYFVSRKGLKEQVECVITSLIRDIREEDMKSSDGQSPSPGGRNNLDYHFIIEPHTKSLLSLGMAPGSYHNLSRYIRVTKVLDPNIFNIILVSSIPNRTNMFSIPR